MSRSPEEILCTWMDESVYEDCGLNEELQCRYNKEAVVCFRKRHIGYRAAAFLVTGVAS